MTTSLDTAVLLWERLTVLRQFTRSLLLMWMLLAIVYLSFMSSFLQQLWSGDDGLMIFSLAAYFILLVFYLIAFAGAIRCGPISGTIASAAVVLVCCALVWNILLSAVGMVARSGHDPAASIPFILAVLGFVVVLELLWAALRLTFPGGNRYLLRDSLTIASFIDAPSDLALISADKPAARGLFAGAAALRCVAILCMAWALLLTGGATALCWTPWACSDLISVLNGLALILGLPLAAAVVSLLVASRLRRLAKARLLQSASEAMQNDTRPPILFLRSFSDDRVELQQRRLSLLRLLLGMAGERAPLDQLLIEEFSIYGPVIAIGKPGEKVPPFGAWRAYIDNSAGERWKEEVAQLAHRALAVVMVIDNTAGVAWEIEHLTEHRLLGKVLFLAPPRYAARDENTHLWKSTFDRLEIDPVPTESILALATKEGRLALASSSEFGRSDYLIALRWFFRSVLRDTSDVALKRLETRLKPLPEQVTS